MALSVFDEEIFDEEMTHLFRFNFSNCDSSMTKVDGPRGLKRTVRRSESGRSRAKLGGPKRVKVDSPKIQKWAVLKVKTGQSFAIKLDGPKSKLNGHFESKWTVL